MDCMNNHRENSYVLKLTEVHAHTQTLTAINCSYRVVSLDRLDADETDGRLGLHGVGDVFARAADVAVVVAQRAAK